MLSTKVLLVDDNPFVHSSMAKHLANEFELTAAENDEQAWDQIEHWHPDIIMLDVEMPGKNGYEICDEIKQSPEGKDIPVVFISSKDSLRERMLGYEVGAVDFFCKDCNGDEIKAKLQAIEKQLKQAKQLKASAMNAEKTAVQALATSSELGKAVRFVEQTYTVKDIHGLGELVLGFCRDLELSIVVMFATEKKNVFISSNGIDVAPIERELMERLHDRERFIDFGCRTLVSFPKVSLLIKNMPIESRECYGRIKDVVPFILGATDARVRMLDTEAVITAQCATLTSSVEAVQLTLTTVKENFHHHLEAVSTIMNELIASISMDINQMGLSEEEENRIMQLIESTSAKLNIILKENTSTDQLLHNLVALLEKLTTEQNNIITKTLTPEEPEQDYQSDIELF